MMEAEGSLEKPRSITTPAEGFDQQHYTDGACYKFLDGEMQKMSQIITQSHLGTSGKFFDGVVQKMSQIITEPRLVTIGNFSMELCRRCHKSSPSHILRYVKASGLPSRAHI